MTNSKKFPRPEGLELDALQDARWDLADNGATTLSPNEDPEKWLYWLCRYEGFAPHEVQVRSHTPTALIIEIP